MKKCKYIFAWFCKRLAAVSFILLLLSLKISAQFPWTEGYGAPIIHQDFGMGNANPNTIGRSLGPGRTDFIFSYDLCPPRGHYTVARRVNVNGCFNDTWIPLSSNNTPGQDLGNIMIVNDEVNLNDKILYVDTVNEQLVPGVKYQFYCAVMNLVKRGTCAGGVDYFAKLRFSVERLDGTVLFSSVSEIGYAILGFGWKYGVIGLTFTLPPGEHPLVLKIYSQKMGAGIAGCANDYAIDDIMLSPLGPKIRAQFLGEPDTKVYSVCYQDNRSVTMVGELDGGYSDEAVQWQQSTDSGRTWIDVPGATDYRFTHSFSEADTFFFRMRASERAHIQNRFGSVVSPVLRVNVDGLPKNYVVSSNSPVCVGQDLKFIGEGGASYLWTGPNGFFDPSPYPHKFYSTHADSGMYYANVITLGGCKLLDSTRVKIIGSDLKVGPDHVICRGESAQLFATGAGSYMWSPADGLSSATRANPVARPAKTTVYEVSADDGTCVATAKVRVRVINSVEVNANFLAPEYICRPTDTASVQNLSTGVLTQYNWDFGNGMSSTEAQPAQLQYFIQDNISGYKIRLYVVDTAGCFDSMEKTIKVADNCYIAIPNAFSPNGDGRNDFLYPANAYKAQKLIFRVFNRYGQIIYETRDWTKGWDGTTNGRPQDPGVYVWTLEYGLPGNKRVAQKGTVMLVR